MYSDQDLIVAPASGTQRAPLAVVRVSGKGSWEIIERFFKPVSQKEIQPWKMMYGHWQDEEGVVDDVMVSAYRDGVSYTGQEMFEVFCHGNPLFVEAIIQTVLKTGGRRAKPGEFTLRAVLNGKMDLLQAEAVHALVEANTRYQAEMIRRQKEGSLVPLVKKQVEAILQLQAHIEATIDYGEEDIDALEREKVVDRLQGVLDPLLHLRETVSFFISLRKGFRVLLTGPPNAGKSTLFNALVKQERAIVTDLPGTTRDLISEEIDLGGLPVVLIDSAGVRDTQDQIERMGLEKIYEILGEVDLVLYLNPAPEKVKPYKKLDDLSPGKWMTIQTKTDMVGAVKEGDLGVSAKTGHGLAELEKLIVEKLSEVMEGHEAYLINQRQEETLGQAVECLLSAKRDYEAGYGEEVLSSYLNTTRRTLGELTGDTTVEDILDRMFANFCLGK